MTTQQWLSVAGALCGSLGSIITAFSLNGVIRELGIARQAIEVTAEALADGGPVPIFTGLDKRHARANRLGTWLLWIGVLLLAAGFILQAISVWAGP